MEEMGVEELVEEARAAAATGAADYSPLQESMSLHFARQAS